MAGSCGYTSDKIEALSTKLVSEISEILDGEIVTVHANADQLTIIAGADLYSYQRADR